MLISGAKTISLPLTLLMCSILFASSLSNSLLSISKIIKHLNCFVTFNSIYYVFHDDLTEMTIGIGKERRGLY